MEYGLRCNQQQFAEGSRRMMRFPPEFEHKAFPPLELGGWNKLHGSKPRRMINRPTRHVPQTCPGLFGAEWWVGSFPALNET